MNVISKILYKYFKLDEDYCKSCETLHRQLELVNDYNRLLLNKLTTMESVKVKDESEPVEQELKPLPMSKRRHVPFAVRQQALVDNDLKTLDLMLKKHKEMNTTTPEVEEKLEDLPESTSSMERDILEAKVN